MAVDYEGGTKLVLGMCLFAKVHKADTTLIGTKGTIEFPRGGKHATIRRPGKADQRIDLPEGGLDKYGHRGTGALYADFLDAIAAGRPPLADVHVGYAALRIPIAAEQAIRRHQVIEMGQFDNSSRRTAL